MGHCDSHHAESLGGPDVVAISRISTEQPGETAKEPLLSGDTAQRIEKRPVVPPGTDTPGRQSSGMSEWITGTHRRPSHRGRVAPLRAGRAAGARSAGTTSRRVSGRDRQGVATSVTSHRVPVCRKPACRG